MTVLAGGVWCGQAFANRVQGDSPSLSPYQMNEWMQLRPDPLGRPYHVLHAKITQGAYAAAPSDSSMRAEAQGQSSVCSWGAVYLHYWRIVVPSDWVNYGPTSYAVVAQLHDVNSSAVPRRPAIAFEIVDNVLSIVMSLDSAPSGQTLFSKHVSPGDELEIGIRVRWADQDHVPASSGFLEIFDGDRAAAQATGLNTWRDPGLADANPPYLKAGIYQPNTAGAWWTGRQLSMCHVASITADDAETMASLRAWVNARLIAASNRQRIALPGR